MVHIHSIAAADVGVLLHTTIHRPGEGCIVGYEGERVCLHEVICRCLWFTLAALCIRAYLIFPISLRNVVVLTSRDCKLWAISGPLPVEILVGPAGPLGELAGLDLIAAHCAVALVTLQESDLLLRRVANGPLPDRDPLVAVQRQLDGGIGLHAGQRAAVNPYIVIPRIQRDRHLVLLQSCDTVDSRRSFVRCDLVRLCEAFRAALNAELDGFTVCSVRTVRCSAELLQHSALLVREGHLIGVGHQIDRHCCAGHILVQSRLTSRILK